MKTIPLTQGYVAKVSDKDYAFLQRFSWSVNVKRSARSRRVYAQATHRQKQIYMHRVVAERMGLSLANQIDHRDGDTLNNMRHNLRAATSQQNKMNRHGTWASSGVKGVYKHGSGWRPIVGFTNKAHYGGTYRTIDEAATARRRMVKRLFGKFSNAG
jgi:hypothetical protein